MTIFYLKLALQKTLGEFLGGWGGSGCGGVPQVTKSAFSIKNDSILIRLSWVPFANLSKYNYILEIAIKVSIKLL